MTFQKVTELVKANDYNGILLELESTPQILNMSGEDGRTLLHLLCDPKTNTNTNIDEYKLLVKKLIENGKLITQVDHQGFSPISACIFVDNVDEENPKLFANTIALDIITKHVQQLVSKLNDNQLLILYRGLLRTVDIDLKAICLNLFGVCVDFTGKEIASIETDNVQAAPLLTIAFSFANRELFEILHLNTSSFALPSFSTAVTFAYHMINNQSPNHHRLVDIKNIFSQFTVNWDYLHHIYIHSVFTMFLDLFDCSIPAWLEGGWVGEPESFMNLKLMHWRKLRVLVVMFENKDTHYNGTKLDDTDKMPVLIKDSLSIEKVNDIVDNAFMYLRCFDKDFGDVVSYCDPNKMLLFFLRLIDHFTNTNTSTNTNTNTESKLLCNYVRCSDMFAIKGNSPGIPTVHLKKEEIAQLLSVGVLLDFDTVSAYIGGSTDVVTNVEDVGKWVKYWESTNKRDWKVINDVVSGLVVGINSNTYIDSETKLSLVKNWLDNYWSNHLNWLHLQCKLPEINYDLYCKKSTYDDDDSDSDSDDEEEHNPVLIKSILYHTHTFTNTNTDTNTNSNTSIFHLVMDKFVSSSIEDKNLLISSPSLLSPPPLTSNEKITYFWKQKIISNISIITLSSLRWLGLGITVSSITQEIIDMFKLIVTEHFDSISDVNVLCILINIAGKIDTFNQTTSSTSQDNITSQCLLIKALNNTQTLSNSTSPRLSPTKHCIDISANGKGLCMSVVAHCFYSNCEEILDNITISRNTEQSKQSPIFSNSFFTCLTIEEVLNVVYNDFKACQCMFNGNIVPWRVLNWLTEQGLSWSGTDSQNHNIAYIKMMVKNMLISAHSPSTVNDPNSDDMPVSHTPTNINTIIDNLSEFEVDMLKKLHCL